MALPPSYSVAERLRKRHHLLRATRSFFDGQGFLEVETPTIVPSPGLEVHLDAFEVVGTKGRRWLSTSPEYQMKRLLAAGMSRIYQLCKCYRRDELGWIHEPEFTMLEWYRAHAGSEEVMRDTEELAAELARLVNDKPLLQRAGRTIDLTPPWQRLTVSEAFARFAGADALALASDEDKFYRVLVEQVEPKLGTERPTFLTHYPARMASLARLVPGRAEVADRFEAYIDGIELCNGFGELTDAREQRSRMVRDQAARERLGKTAYPIDEKFIAALEQGLPPSGGNALGMDRLIMLLLGADDIQGVMAFPTALL
jgi:elongation factor P--(R)-beta-lysine ligase